MDIPEGIFKAYDIRGTYPDQLNEEMVPNIIKAIIKRLTEGFNEPRAFKVVLARDMRLSSPKMHDAAVKTLLDCGIDVLDLGMVDTPSVYFATLHYKVDGGIQITASHNPGNYNGIKVVKNTKDKGLLKIGQNSGMDKIKEWSINGVEISADRKGTFEEADTEELFDAEVKTAAKICGLKFRDDGKIDLKPFRIVADAANAMAAVYLNGLFKYIDTDLVRMNFDLDGTFPNHPADPLVPENLVDLQKKVLEEKADLGLAPDGDGDRLMFVDEKGGNVKPSVITALVAQEILKLNPGDKVLFDIRYIYTPQKIVEENGGEWALTRVGHAFISQKMVEVDGVFGGESSGHYFFRETGYAEFQMPIALFVLKAMSESGKSISEIAKDLERSHESGEVNFRVKNAKELIKILQDRFAEGEVIDIDGVAISYPDWRVSLRTSNTEPLLRLNIEHLDPDKLPEKKEEIIKLIEEHARYE